MIVIPTEKRLDWKHPPYVVFCLALLNILFFVVNQNSDTTRHERAVEIYEQQGFIEWEAPAFLTYLKQNNILANEPDRYEEYNQLFDENPSALTDAIIFDLGFEEYFKENQTTWLPDEKQALWRQMRPLVSQNINNISAMSFGLIPQKMSLITVFSHQFLHGGIMHLLGNLIFLIICGFAVEAALGSGRFLIFYLIGGVVAGLSYSVVELLGGRGGGPLIGASGAISAVMAMYLMLYKMQRIEFFYWFTIFVGYFKAPALLILPIYLGKELLSFFSDEPSSVAYMAHAGGFVAGALLVAFTQLHKPATIDQTYLEEDQDHDPRRDSLQTIMADIESCQFAQALKKIELHIVEHGHCVESGYIRVNLLGAVPDEDWQLAYTEYMSRSSMNRELILNQRRLWKKASEDTKQAFDDLTAVQLAMRFIEAQHHDDAELIAISLFKKQSKEPLLAKLMGQLSGFYREVGNPKKQQQFESAVDTLLAAHA